MDNEEMYAELFNAQGEINSKNFQINGDYIVINNEIKGRIIGNKIVVGENIIGTKIKSDKGTLILNDKAYQKYISKKVEQNKNRKLHIRKIRIGLTIAAISLSSLISIYLTSKVKDRKYEKEAERIETLQENKDIVDNYFKNAIADSNLTDDQIKNLLMPIESIPMDKINDYLKYRAKLLYAQYMGIEYSDASRISIDPHYEKADGEWVATIHYLDKYTNMQQENHTNNLDKLGKDIIMLAIDASNINPEKADEKKLKESYTERFADLITALDEKQLTGSNSKGGFNN